MPGRKIGVGFNQPRVLGGQQQRWGDWRVRWAFTKRLTRLVRGGTRRSRRRSKVFAASAVETHRLMMMDR